MFKRTTLFFCNDWQIYNIIFEFLIKRLNKIDIARINNYNIVIYA